jgi:hypothetical protein
MTRVHGWLVLSNSNPVKYRLHYSGLTNNCVIFRKSETIKYFYWGSKVDKVFWDRAVAEFNIQIITPIIGKRSFLGTDEWFDNLEKVFGSP